MTTLKLKIEEQFVGGLHSSLVDELNLIASRAGSLDEALVQVRRCVARELWACGRGGHHVWISLIGGLRKDDFTRVATIVEEPETPAPARSKKDEMKLIVAIAERAEKMFRQFGVEPPARFTLVMDLDFTNRQIPLDLEAMLAGSDSDFSHDVGGIVRHMDRQTCKLGGCFLPRFARRAS